MKLVENQIDEYVKSETQKSNLNSSVTKFFYESKLDLHFIKNTTFAFLVMQNILECNECVCYIRKYSWLLCLQAEKKILELGHENEMLHAKHEKKEKQFKRLLVKCEDLEASLELKKKEEAVLRLDAEKVHS